MTALRRLLQRMQRAVDSNPSFVVISAPSYIMANVRINLGLSADLQH